MKYSWIYGAVGLLLLSQATFASGFQLREQSPAMQGLSFAGSTAKGDDLGTLFFNPAGMSRLEGTRLMVGASYIAPSAEMSLESTTAALGGGGMPAMSDGNGGDAGVSAVLPTFYMKTDTRYDGVDVGLAIMAPFGLATEYDDGWAGRYYALKSELQTVNIQPTISYKMNPKLAVGVGLNIQRAEAELTNAVNYSAIAGGAAFADGHSRLEGYDWGYGYTLGIMYEPVPETRIGLSYRSRVKHTLEGDIEFSNLPGALAGVSALQDADVDAALTTPDTLSLGIHHQVNDRLSVMADVAYTNWSVFENLTVTESAGGQIRQNVEEKWTETLFSAIGAEYIYDDKTVLRAGVAYDESPVVTGNHTFRIPDTDRLWVSAGFSHQLKDNVTLDLGYSHIFTDELTITEGTDPNLRGVVSGTYESDVDILAVGLRYKF